MLKLELTALLVVGWAVVGIDKATKAVVPSCVDGSDEESTLRLVLR